MRLHPAAQLACFPGSALSRLPGLRLGAGAGAEPGQGVENPQRCLCCVLQGRPQLDGLHPTSLSRPLPSERHSGLLLGVHQKEWKGTSSLQEAKRHCLPLPSPRAQPSGPRLLGRLPVTPGSSMLQPRPSLSPQNIVVFSADPCLQGPSLPTTVGMGTSASHSGPSH